MGYKIACWTLFDITCTGVINRSTPPVDVQVEEWIKQRNTQCNYDTVLQIISLRSQPENVSRSQQVKINKEIRQYFGSKYKFGKNSMCWMFEFTIQNAGVFNNGIQELGTLFVDSHDVPMILIGTEHADLWASLNTAPNLKNIHYKITSYDDTTN